MHPRRPYVPSKLIKRQIELFIEDNPETTQEELERLTGCPMRRLFDILHDRQEVVWFITADKILTGLDRQLQWYHDPELAEYYDAAA